jgi:hypothetical protein
LYQRKQAKLELLQHPSEINRNKLNNARCEATPRFRNKKRQYLKEKYELAMNREINEFNRGYQPRNYLVMDENGNLLAHSHNILNKWKN